MIHYATLADVEPYGMRCMECDKLIEVGDPIGERLEGWAPAGDYHPDVDGSNGIPIVEIVCGSCYLIDIA